MDKKHYSENVLHLILTVGDLQWSVVFCLYFFLGILLFFLAMKKNDTVKICCHFSLPAFP